MLDEFQIDLIQSVLELNIPCFLLIGQIDLKFASVCVKYNLRENILPALGPQESKAVILRYFARSFAKYAKCKRSDEQKVQIDEKTWQILVNTIDNVFNELDIHLLKMNDQPISSYVNAMRRKYQDIHNATIETITSLPIPLELRVKIANLV
jgi:hypothetical protein